MQQDHAHKTSCMCLAMCLDLRMKVMEDRGILCHAAAGVTPEELEKASQAAAADPEVNQAWSLMPIVLCVS